MSCLNDDEKMNQTTDIDNEILEKYRKTAKSYMDLHHYNAAVFWADKVVSLSNGNVRDICNLAQCMFFLKQYHRAAHLIRSQELEKKDINCYYLAVRSLLEAKEYNEVLQVISESEASGHSMQSTMNFVEQMELFDNSPKNLISSIFYVKGRAYEATDNRVMATNCYKEALRLDVYSYQSFEALVQNQMLTAKEERELLDSLPINEQCSRSEAELLRLMYENKLKKYQEPMAKPANCANENLVERLVMNLDFQVSEAERLYYLCDYQQCFALTEKILTKDPYHNGCLQVHISCLVELKKTNTLFYLAHKLVDLYPDMALSWFAVGSYYYIIGKSDQARRFLAKATSLDRLFGPAWLAYGHSFAVENEHDQAMVAYFKAAQLMKGCHLPFLYIGLECGLSNNHKMAERFFLLAQEIAPNDPFVLHEMGVIAFRNGDFQVAESHMKKAMSNLHGGFKDSVMPKKWESLLNDLGHACRKLKKLDEALVYHQQALVLDPMNPSTYSAIGFVHALAKRNENAVEAFHKALGLRRDDTIATTMLATLVEQLAYDTPPFPDAPTEMSTYNSKSKQSVSDESSSEKSKSNSFSSWNIDSKPSQNENPSHAGNANVSFLANEMSSEIEMIDSSTALIEDS